MIRLILGILLILAVVIIFKLLLAKKKKRSDLSESEKFLLTIKSKITKAFKDLNDGLRTPDVIQEEIIQLLDSYKTEAIKSFKRSGELLVSQKSDLKKSLDNVIENIKDIDIRVREYKKKYEETNDEALKQTYMHAGTSLLKSKHNFERSKTKIEDALKKAESAKENMLKKCEAMDVKIQVKRAEVLALISDYINGSGDINVDINFSDIDFLVDEYKLVAEKESYGKEIEKKFEKPEKEDLSVEGDKELEDEFKKL